MNSVRLVFVQRFLREVRTYFSELESMQRLLASTASTAKRIAAETSHQLGASTGKCKENERGRREEEGVPLLFIRLFGFSFPLHISLLSLSPIYP
jgi:hypothetical protein